jgi:hypothetical protein
MCEVEGVRRRAAEGLWIAGGCRRAAAGNCVTAGRSAMQCALRRVEVCLMRLMRVKCPWSMRVGVYRVYAPINAQVSAPNFSGFPCSVRSRSRTQPLESSLSPPSPSATKNLPNLPVVLSNLDLPILSSSRLSTWSKPFLQLAQPASSSFTFLLSLSPSQPSNSIPL